MSDMMRKMLDELMGTNRDGVQGADAVKFTDTEVCKSYLLGLCPYDLFHNTNSFKSSKKLDLGVCSKLHDPALKADYELAAKDKKYEYEFQQFDQITKFVEDCDRKVAANKKRLEETQDQESLSPEAVVVHELNEKIGKKLSEAEELGAAGDVEESMKIMAECEELKNEKRKAEEAYRNAVPATQNQQQKLRVCEICAAFLSLYDNDRRLADHFGGRLHMGFISVRDRLEELTKSIAEKRETRTRDRDRERSDRDRDRDQLRRRSRSRERRRESARDEKDKERGDRDKDRRRSERDVDRERKRRSRSRSRDRSDRNRRSSRRSRSGSRENRRRDRERSRERERRDRRSRRSRERSRDRSSRDRDRDRTDKGKSSSSIADEEKHLMTAEADTTIPDASDVSLLPPQDQDKLPIAQKQDDDMEAQDEKKVEQTAEGEDAATSISPEDY